MGTRVPCCTPETSLALTEDLPMAMIDPPTGPERNPFLSPDEPTLADVLACLEADWGLLPTRKRDLRSAIHGFCRLTDRDPSMVAASVAELKSGLGTVNAARAGLSKKTLDNLRSNLLAALRESGIRVAPNTAKQKLTSDWRDLVNRLPSTRLRNGLSRFTRYCSATGVRPGEVDDNTIDAFVNALRYGTFVTDPRALHRQTCRLWNEAADTIPGWPQRRVTVPSFKPTPMTLPLDAYPPSFGAEVEEHLRWMEDKDAFADHPPPTACKPLTIKHRRQHILGAAAALTRRGRAAADIRSLADLVAVDAVKEVLREYLERYGGGPTQYIRDLGKALMLVARHWVRVGPDHLDQLKEIKRRLGSDRAGMTEKNRAMLRQFEDPHTLGRLLLLPRHLLVEAGRCPPDSKRSAIKAQLAVAIELLLMAPIRMGNLIAIRSGHELLRPGGHGGPYRLVIEAADTKNGDSIEFELPPELSEAIDLYLRDYHPRLTDPANMYLFPARTGGHKGQETLSKQIKALLREHLGFPMTPHQFRHLGACLYLRRHPGDYVTVQKLLGHKNIKTTMSFYAKLDTAMAARYYDALIADERAALATLVPRGRRGRP